MGTHGWVISPKIGDTNLVEDYSSKMFDANYYAHGCGDRPYQRDQVWLEMFEQIANRIYQDIQPKTVLDAGCAYGFLVESLRNRDIEAFGIDISEFAIENVHADIKSYCWQGSITEPFPQKYDLIVTIEVLEHMPKVQAEAAVANLCKHSNDVLFSSSPFDYKEPTHFNVQPPEYWVSIFSRHGFYRDVDFDASFITPWTVRFRKLHDPIQRVIAAYERKLWLVLQDSQGQRDLNRELRDQLVSLKMEMEKKEEQIKDLEIEVGNNKPGYSNTWISRIKAFFDRF
jgi:SAM-dependent methyltransferase